MQFATILGIVGLVAPQTAALVVSNKNEGPFVESMDCWNKKNSGTKYRGLKTTTASGRTCQNWARGAPHQGSVNYLMGDYGTGNHNFCRNPGQEFGEPWCFTTDPNPMYERETCGIPACAFDERDYAADAQSFKNKVSAENLHCDCADALYGSTVTTKDTRVALAQHTVKGRLIEGKCVCDTSLLDTNHSGVDDTHCYKDKGEDYNGLATVTQSGRTCKNWVHSGLPAEGNHNYCRNPDGTMDMPWCFTVDPQVEKEACNVPKCPENTPSYVDKAKELANAIKKDPAPDCKCAAQLYGSTLTTKDTKVPVALSQRRQQVGKMVNGRCVCPGGGGDGDGEGDGR